MPPRVRNFLWVVSIDRLPTKDFLIRRGCYSEPETAVHLFFHCKFIVGFWRKFLNGVVKSLWMISVSAACWSMRLVRNELVFIRALMWIRSVHEELKVDEKIYLGWVKFNVCSVEIEDEVGCGGVLRDSDGMARALSSGLFAAKDSLTVEVGAISLALDVFLAMGWKGKCSLIIEVGSIEVFNWVENKVEIRLSRIGNISFLKADKHGNKMAFVLAVSSLKRPGMFKA
ncbi:hypothetical protein ES319_D08G053300v1 [Gossypium barbadense]|uniref:Reverse transcriptase zinc-binding domain-containing protein n=2 Tax=Gossypium TaxID=3633 RepID=A0A5J5QC05_GOSBA|nr:hypothetical protein ES319_D08G053300v1 [Gossypium barbadense]TYG56350.1 hypothetical protein ES288_D08G057400v1 [Gossypium darwinii]